MMAALSLDTTTTTSEETGKHKDDDGAQEEEEEEEEVEKECAICIEKLVGEGQKEGIKVPLCGHMFHRLTCLEAWCSRCEDKNIMPTCPICRGPIFRKRGMMC